MASSNKVIITCAVTGAIHTPSMSPYLPVTADEIAEAAIGAAEAGAAIVHLHARDEKTGRPDQSPEAFARFLPRIKQSTKAVVNLTTGGAPYMTLEERVRPRKCRPIPDATKLRQFGATEPEVPLAVLPTAQSETPVPPKSATVILAQETGARSPCAAPDAEAFPHCRTPRLDPVTAATPSSRHSHVKS